MIGALVILFLLAVVIAVLANVYIDEPRRLERAADAKRPIQYRLPGF